MSRFRIDATIPPESSTPVNTVPVNATSVNTTSGRYWAVLQNQTSPVGPLTREDLVCLLDSGSLNYQSPVRELGSTQWQDLHAVLPQAPSLRPQGQVQVTAPPVEVWNAATSDRRRSWLMPVLAAFTIGGLLSMNAVVLFTRQSSEVDSLAAGGMDSGVYESSSIDDAISGGNDRMATKNLTDEDAALDRMVEHLRRSETEVSTATDQPEVTEEKTSPEHIALRDRAASGNGSTRERNAVAADSVTIDSNAPPEQTPAIRPGVSAEDVVSHEDRVLENKGFINDQRRWTDMSGRYSTTARLADVQGLNVVLMKSDGRAVRVPRSRLSLRDAVFVDSVEDLFQKPQPRDHEDAAEAVLASVKPANRVGPRAVAGFGRKRSVDEVDRARFFDYLDRRKERRIYGLEARRLYNASKGPHVYRTAISVPVNPLGFNAIQAGWVRQPPIPRPYWRSRYRYFPRIDRYGY